MHIAFEYLYNNTTPVCYTNCSPKSWYYI